MLGISSLGDADQCSLQPSNAPPESTLQRARSTSLESSHHPLQLQPEPDKLLPQRASASVLYMSDSLDKLKVDHPHGQHQHPEGSILLSDGGGGMKGEDDHLMGSDAERRAMTYERQHVQAHAAAHALKINTDDSPQSDDPTCSTIAYAHAPRQPLGDATPATVSMTLRSPHLGSPNYPSPALRQERAQAEGHALPPLLVSPDQQQQVQHIQMQLQQQMQQALEHQLHAPHHPQQQQQQLQQQPQPYLVRSSPGSHPPRRHSFDASINILQANAANAISSTRTPRGSSTAHTHPPCTACVRLEERVVRLTTDARSMSQLLLKYVAPECISDTVWARICSIEAGTTEAAAAAPASADALTAPPLSSPASLALLQRQRALRRQRNDSMDTSSTNTSHEQHDDDMQGAAAADAEQAYLDSSSGSGENTHAELDRRDSLVTVGSGEHDAVVERSVATAAAAAAVAAPTATSLYLPTTAAAAASGQWASGGSSVAAGSEASTTASVAAAQLATVNPFCKPCPLLSNLSKHPLRVFYVDIPREYTMSAREAARQLTSAERATAVRVPIRIMGRPLPPGGDDAAARLPLPSAADATVLPVSRSSVWVVSKDLCAVLHIRKGNVAKSIAHLEAGVCRASMPVLCRRAATGTVSTHILTVLSIRGVQRLLSSSRSPLAPRVSAWMQQQFDELCGGPEDAQQVAARVREQQAWESKQPSLPAQQAAIMRQQQRLQQAQSQAAAAPAGSRSSSFAPTSPPSRRGSGSGAAATARASSAASASPATRKRKSNPVPPKRVHTPDQATQRGAGGNTAFISASASPPTSAAAAASHSFGSNAPQQLLRRAPMLPPSSFSTPCSPMMPSQRGAGALDLPPLQGHTLSAAMSNVMDRRASMPAAAHYTVAAAESVAQAAADTIGASIINYESSGQLDASTYQQRHLFEQQQQHHAALPPHLQQHSHAHPQLLSMMQHQHSIQHQRAINKQLLEQQRLQQQRLESVLLLQSASPHSADSSTSAAASALFARPDMQHTASGDSTVSDSTGMQEEMAGL